MTKNNSPLVSIIIVNWNGGKVFEDCLGSLSKITYQNWELVIVDNGSTDGSDNYHKKLSAKQVKFIQNKENVGFALANNQGYEVVNGEYVLLLNNDTKVESDFLTKMITQMQKDKTLGVMQPKIKMMDDPQYLDNAGSFFTSSGFLQHWGFGERDSKEFNFETEVFTVKGACMLVRREVIKKVGLFDSDFVSYFEETDFCWRVWLAGYRCVYYPAATIYHKVGFTSKRLEVVDVNTISLRNRVVSLMKNLSTANLFIILPFHLTILVGLMTYHLVKFELKKSKMYANTLMWNILNLGRTFTKRKSVQELRKVSDKLIFDKVGRKLDIFEMFKHFTKVEKNFKI